MRQLHPNIAEVEPVPTYLAAHRPLPAERPWVVVGMISSIDGATAVDGKSGGLGGPADKAVFRAVRSLADVILVGAGTVRAEGYGPVRFRDEVKVARRAVGRDDTPPRLAIVTSSCDLDLTGELFTGDGPPPIVFTTTSAPDDAVDATSALTDVHRVGRDRVDLRAAMSVLHADGVEIVVSEGGPRLNGALSDAGLIDELCVTLAPLVAGGDSARIVAGAAETDGRYELATLLTDDGMLFGRWTRA